jgi:hypothetical protein
MINKMEKRKNEVLVIYRLKFKSEQDFEKAAETFRFGQNMGKYLESLQGSFGLQRPQPNNPMINPPEINFCKDDLVIFICSYEFGQSTKGSPNRDIVIEGIAESMPRFPHYYELFLKGTFGSIAEVSIATGEHV